MLITAFTDNCCPIKPSYFQKKSEIPMCLIDGSSIKLGFCNLAQAIPLERDVMMHAAKKSIRECKHVLPLSLLSLLYQGI